MGLDIRTVSSSGQTIKDERFGSYGRIHELRKWIYKNLDGYSDEQITSFYDYHNNNREDIESRACPAICNHADSEGGYLNPEEYKVLLKDLMFWADIRDLEKEVDLLRGKEIENEEVREIVNDLYDLLHDEDGDLVSIIYFN